MKVLSVLPHTGQLPPYGESYPCSSLPVTLSKPYVSGTDTLLGRVCLVPGVVPSADRCSLHGAVETTPETESCASGYALAIFKRGTSLMAQAGYRSAAAWTVGSTTHGTKTDTRTVSDLPAGTAVKLGLRFDSPFRQFSIGFVATDTIAEIKSVTSP